MGKNNFPKEALEKQKPLLTKEEFEIVVSKLETDEILLYPQAAKLLQVSVQTLEHRVKVKAVPFFRVGRSVRFMKNALLLSQYRQMRTATNC